MHRFFIEHIKGNSVILSDAVQLHHIRDVLRHKINDAVIISDGAGNEYNGVITAINKKQAVFSLTPMQTPKHSSVALTIVCAIPKGSHLDEIIDGLTQLGVKRIIPMMTDRVVVKLDDAKLESRLKRWQTIAQSAARQCQRSDIPVIEPVTDIKQVVTDTQNFDLKLIPHLSGRRKSIKSVISKKSYKNIIALIGPEGDFTPSEVELALHNGFTPVSLGDTVLRVATAAITVAAYIRFALDK
jgi:16S rRNA (uracil1498-N3)-methyltransferase